MARPAVDIRLIGDKALIRALSKLPVTSQKKAVRPALRKAAKRLRGHIVENVSGTPVGVVSGRTLAAFTAARIRALKRSRSAIGVGVVMPTREELGIDPGDKWFHPAATEYGTVEREGRGSIDETRFIRDAVDIHKAREIATLGTDIGKGIERHWRRLTK